MPLQDLEKQSGAGGMALLCLPLKQRGPLGLTCPGAPGSWALDWPRPKHLVPRGLDAVKDDASEAPEEVEHPAGKTHHDDWSFQVRPPTKGLVRVRGACQHWE